MSTSAGPWRLTGFAAAQLVLFPLVVVVVVLTALSGVLAIVTVGVPTLLVSLPALRWLADRHRSMAARVLGHPVPADHRPTDGQSALRRTLTWARDPMTWREIGWALVGAPLGFLLSLLTVLLLVLVVTGLIWWFGTPHLMWARATLDRWFLSKGHSERLEERVEVLTESRSAAVDHASAELRRVERDLHDGAQARLVALGMTLGLAEETFAHDPQAAVRMVGEARETTAAVLGDIRHVVQGIHPPVLSDRGLTGALQALALDLAMPVTVQSSLDERLPEPIESAAYFAATECLANLVKHAAAEHAWVTVGVADDVLTLVVGDDGIGGADPDAGTGLRGSPVD